MGCDTIRMPDGGFAIVCSRGRRHHAAPPPKCRCGRPATLLCDHPQPGGGTCDRPICATCARVVGPDRHHCPVHDQGTLL